jgi:hypothetical protein
MSNVVDFDFFRYFDEILKNRNISVNAKIAYLYLCRCHGTDGKIHPKIATISERIGLSLTRTKYALKELSGQGLIKISRTGRSNRYKLLSTRDSPDMGHQNLDSPEMDHHDSPNVDHQIAQKQTITNNKTTRKQKRNNNVVVVSPEISLLLDRVRKGVNLEDQGLLETLKEGIVKFGRQSMIERIEYANQKANGNYPGFLATMIRKGWSVPETKKHQPLPPDKKLHPSTSLAGKTIIYKGVKYTIDPETLCIRPKGGGVLPIGMIIQGVKRGTIEVLDNI